MNLDPKIKLGVIIFTFLLLISLVILVFKIKSAGRNYFFLDSVNNKFKIHFQISSRDQKNFDYFANVLSLPINLKEDTEFELDSTSSSEIAFISPIKSSINFSNKSAYFDGNLSIPLEAEEIKAESLKAPDSAVFAIFLPSLEKYLENQYQFSKTQEDWLKDNFYSQNGQYLIIFDQKNFALFTKNENPNLDNLKNNSKETSNGLAIQQDLDNNQTGYIFKTTLKDKTEANILITKLDNWLIITNSQDAANETINAQKLKNPNIDFKSVAKNKSASFILIYKFKENLSKENLSSLVQVTNAQNSNQENITNALKNISEANFVLSKDHFSGLIKLK